MPTCRIIFSGLCAFVPHGGSFLDPKDPPISITALLPNVLDPVDIGEDILVPSHFPLLEFNIKNESSGSAGDFLYFQKFGDQDDKGLYPLLRRDIEILVDGQLPQDTDVKCRHQPVEYPDYLDDDVAWLISLGYAYGNPCAVKPELLRSLVGYDDLVTTRIELRTGEFLTYEVVEQWYVESLKDLELLKDSVLVPAGPRRNASRVPDYEKVATKMALEFDFDEDVTFVMKEYGGKDPRTLVFSLPQDRPHEDVEIVIKNLEANEHFGIPVDTSTLYAKYKTPKTTTTVVKIDPDLEVYRKLLKFACDSEVDSRVLAGLITTTTGKPCSPVGVPESLPQAVSATDPEDASKSRRGPNRGRIGNRKKAR